MCDFCHKHGEGKKWYLQAKNYSDDLMSDLRRRNFVQEFFSDPESLGQSVQKLEKLDRAPRFVKRVLTKRISNKMKKIHYGQVVPMEEIERIFEFVTSIFRLACICRQVTVGSEQRYCYGVSLAPNGGKMAKIISDIDASYLTGPDVVGLEMLSKDEALASLRDHENQGLCHTVWTFIAPFIGGICNCDRSDCLAMRTTLTYEVPLFFRAEYVAIVNPDLCTGCRECMHVCQFGAIGYSVAQSKISIDVKKCYGCGLCRSACINEAISLSDRTSIQIASRI